MKARILFAAATLIAIGTGAVIAQSDPIAARKALMKGNNDGAGVLVRMMRGTEPFDASKVDPVFAQWAETAQKLPGLFRQALVSTCRRLVPALLQPRRTHFLALFHWSTHHNRSSRGGCVLIQVTMPT